MNFQLDEIQTEIKEIAAKFAEKEIAPVVDEDETNSYFRKEIFQKAGSAGLLGITTPESFGGSGLGFTEYAIALEEIAYQSSGYATSLSVTGLPKRMIEQFGTNEQKSKYIPGLLSGEKIGCFCLTESDSGSDAKAMRTYAKLKGDHYILNGTKQFITNGMHADVMLVMARTNPKNPNAIGAFIVENTFKGVKGGKLEKKMGMRCSPTQEIIFDNCEVPKENLLGKENEGFKCALTALDAGRIAIGAIANGLSRAAFTTAAQYANEREQFNQPIIQFQGIGFLLADMATELEASKLLVFQAASLKDHNKPFTMQASIAKLKSTDACMFITTNAVQILGGYGYMEEYKVERWMREAKMLQLVEGTSQIQKLVISKNLIQ